MQPEVVLNLWYVADQSGLAFSLKGRAYVATGSEDEKLNFLNSRALLDYLIAQDFPIPEKFHTYIDGQKIKGVFMQDLRLAGLEMAVFEDSIKAMESQFSKLNKLNISANPIVSITPLHFTDDLKIVPFQNMTKQADDQQVKLFDYDENFPVEEEDNDIEEVEEEDEENIFEDYVREKVGETLDSILKKPEEYNITEEDIKFLESISENLFIKSDSEQFTINAKQIFCNGEMTSAEFEMYYGEITLKRVMYIDGPYGGDTHLDIIFESSQNSYSAAEMMDFVTLIDNWCESFEDNLRNGEIAIEIEE